MSRPGGKSSAETAASFLKSYERRRSAVREPPKPRVPPKVVRRSDPRVALPNKIGPDTLFVLLTLPIATYNELMDHCIEFGIRPDTFVKKMLEQAKLSRGGV